jgi:acyl transferase domain-containing protein
VGKSSLISGIFSKLCETTAGTAVVHAHSVTPKRVNSHRVSEKKMLYFAGALYACDTEPLHHADSRNLTDSCYTL